MHAADAACDGQALADRFHVSRFPIQKALKILTDKGVVTHEPRRGYFVAEPGAHGTATDETATADPLSDIYFRIGEDRLSGKLPQSVSEKLMRERYDLSQANLKSLLNRMLSEGWIERRQGYGWRFHDMLTTPDALVQTYRMRAALERSPVRLSTMGRGLDEDEAAFIASAVAGRYAAGLIG